jgi:hypothetical protein
MILHKLRRKRVKHLHLASHSQQSRTTQLHRDVRYRYNCTQRIYIRAPLHNITRTYVTNVITSGYPLASPFLLLQLPHITYPLKFASFILHKRGGVDTRIGDLNRVVCRVLTARRLWNRTYVERMGYPARSARYPSRRMMNPGTPSCTSVETTCFVAEPP